jgi:hypothetical protein
MNFWSLTSYAERLKSLLLSSWWRFCIYIVQLQIMTNLITSCTYARRCSGRSSAQFEPVTQQKGYIGRNISCACVIIVVGN